MKYILLRIPHKDSSNHLVWRYVFFNENGVESDSYHTTISDTVIDAQTLVPIGPAQQWIGLKAHNKQHIFVGDYLSDMWDGMIDHCVNCKSFQLFFQMDTDEYDYCAACNGDIHFAEFADDEDNLIVTGNYWEKKLDILP